VKPGAALEDNPAGQLFEKARRRDEGHCYATPAEQIAAVEQDLQGLVGGLNRVRALTGWAWIRTALRPSANSTPPEQIMCPKLLGVQHCSSVYETHGASTAGLAQKWTTPGQTTRASTAARFAVQANLRHRIPLGNSATGAV
jgi:hypothetical protein